MQFEAFRQAPLEGLAGLLPSTASAADCALQMEGMEAPSLQMRPSPCTGSMP